MPLAQDQKKRFRQIGHHLKPVVMVAEKGLTKNVLNELERALEDHELIKIKLAILDREAKRTTIDTICKHAGAEIVQTIGKTALIYRAAKKPNPKLSNVLRNHS
ncbi:MAG: ribosome assembly RNA-binding protein YhbY [Moraxellaceae bacterium]|nr:MAG: ribosome assembly RNA-binding protein YhbY [Moraxellaceae bacterium]